MQSINVRFAVSVLLLASLWVITFFDNLVAMEAIWRRSDTFAHGYFVLPIVLWLFWRDRAYLLNSNTQTSLLAVPFIIGSLCLLLFAYATDINVLGQLSAVFALISLVWLVLGNKLAWHYKFPLAYLIFLVPMGENFIPQLQDITAWFTVLFLKLHGIPVFRDGLYLQIPNGLFEVAVACSGIRYLIASVAVGTLFAYLSYNSFKKQLIFFLFSIALPILANGLRAYLIVIIAHYSDMEYATGADHLVYGWVFFGLVIMLMFWAGGKFSDPELSSKESAILAKKQSVPSRFSLAAIALVLVSTFGALAVKQNIPVAKSPAQPLARMNNLLPVSQSNWGIEHVNALQLSHGINSQNIEVFTAQYANLQDKGELISFHNKLHDEDSWTVIERETFNINDQPVVFIGLRSITGKTRSYLYRYKIGEYSTGSAVFAKLYQAMNSILRRSDFSSIEAISIVDGDDYRSDKALLIELFTDLFMKESTVDGN